jgi:hypothetical protein
MIILVIYILYTSLLSNYSFLAFYFINHQLHLHNNMFHFQAFTLYHSIVVKVNHFYPLIQGIISSLGTSKSSWMQGASYLNSYMFSQIKNIIFLITYMKCIFCLFNLSFKELFSKSIISALSLVNQNSFSMMLAKTSKISNLTPLFSTSFPFNFYLPLRLPKQG